MKYLVVLFFGLITNFAFAQIVVKPLPTMAPKAARVSGMQSHTIVLPFWDDFSTSTGLVDTTWWLAQSQNQVIVKSGIGIDPPSIGVATFDGVDALGIPYLPASTDGDVDSLVSQPIDLTQIPTNLRNTVYLSFFYQFRGLGEAPEEKDSLILYFKNTNGTWDKMWPKNTVDFYNRTPEEFTEIFIEASDPKYFHTEFQFMFKAEGRQNGWVDNWLVDYVYMDKRRSSTDNSYLDRTFTSMPTSIFDQYTAIPFDDFVATVNKDELFQQGTLKLRNLENDIQPIEFSVKLYDTLNNVLIENVGDFATIINKNELLEVIANPIDPSLLDQSLDSLYLMLEYSYLASGDTFLIDSIYNNNQDTTFYSNIDLRVNDVTKSYFTLKDYYAYDDGTAEYGSGINQPLGKMAVQFEVVVGKYLDRIDMYFPNIEGNQAGTPLEIFVLNDFEGNENSLLLQSNVAVDHTGINEFIEFNLPRPLFVTDTFFIGFTNLSSNEGWFGVGLDKNTDSYDKVYTNVDGNWVKNTDIHGSLMIRPHFTKETPILSVHEEDLLTIEVYPNPTHGSLKIDGEFNSIQLIDLLGKQVPFKMVNGYEVLFEVNAKQILLLLIETDNGIISKRIMAIPTNQ